MRWWWYCESQIYCCNWLQRFCSVAMCLSHAYKIDILVTLPIWRIFSSLATKLIWESTRSKTKDFNLVFMLYLYFREWATSLKNYVSLACTKYFSLLCFLQIIKQKPIICSLLHSVQCSDGVGTNFYNFRGSTALA